MRHSALGLLSILTLALVASSGLIQTASAAIEARDADTDAALALCKQDHSADLHDHWRSAEACSFLISSGQFQDNDLAALYNDRGVEHESMNMLDEAFADYTRALELKPDYSVAARNLADIYAKRDEWDKSLELAEKAVALAPEAASGLRRRAYAHRNLENFDKAQTDLEIALALDPDDGWTLRELGWLEYDRGDYEASAKRFQNAIDRHSNDAENHYALAYVLIDMDRDSEAIRTINNAIALSEHADYFNLRGFVLLQEDKQAFFDLDRAVADLNKAMELDPELHFPVYHLAAARVMQGRPDDAVTLLRRGLDLQVDKFKGRRILRLLLRNGHFLTAAQVASILNRSEDDGS
ncbi:MAG: tetratricopeptide repeat protein [Paracoccaceae bacterium]